MMISMEAHASIGLLAACCRSMLASGWSTGSCRAQDKALQLALCVTTGQLNRTSLSNSTNGFSTHSGTAETCQGSRAQIHSSMNETKSARLLSSIRQPVFASLSPARIANETASTTIWWQQYQQQRSMAGLGAAWKRRVLKQRSQMLEQTLAADQFEEHTGDEHDSDEKQEHKTLQTSRDKTKHRDDYDDDQIGVKQALSKRSKLGLGVEANTELHVDAWEQDMQQARKQRLEEYYQDSSWKGRDRKVENKLQPRRDRRRGDDSDDDEMQSHRLRGQQGMGSRARYTDRYGEEDQRPKQRSHFQESRGADSGYVDMESDFYSERPHRGGERGRQQPDFDKRPAARLFKDKDANRGASHDRRPAFRVIDEDISGQARARVDVTSSQEGHARKQRGGMSSTLVDDESEQGSERKPGGRQQSAASRWYQLVESSRNIKNPAARLSQLEAMAMEAASAANFRIAINGIGRAGQLLGRIKSECSDFAVVGTHAALARNIISRLIPKLKGRELQGMEISSLILSCAAAGYDMDQDMLAEVLHAVTKDNCSLLLNSPEKAMVQLMHGLATLLGYKPGSPAGEQEATSSPSDTAAQKVRTVSETVKNLRSTLMKDVGQLISKHAEAISANALAPLLASFSRLGCTDVEMYEAAAKSLTDRQSELTTASVSSLGITNRNLLNYDCKVPGLLQLVGDKIAAKPLELLPSAWPDLLLPFAAFKHAHPAAVAALLQHLPAKLKDMHPLRAALLVQSAVNLEPQLVAQQQDMLRSVTQHAATYPADSKTIAACAILMTAWGRLGLSDHDLFRELCTAASSSMAQAASTAQEGQDPANNHTEEPTWVNQPLLPVLLAESARAGVLHPNFQPPALSALARALPRLPAEASALVAQAAADIYALSHDSLAGSSPGHKPIANSGFNDLDTDSVKQLATESGNALATAMQQLLKMTPQQLTQWTSQHHHKQFTAEQVNQLQPAALLLHQLIQSREVTAQSFVASSFVGLTNATDNDAFVEFQNLQHKLHHTASIGVSNAGQLMATVFAEQVQGVQQAVYVGGLIVQNPLGSSSSIHHSSEAGSVEANNDAQNQQDRTPNGRTALLAAAMGRLYQGEAMRKGVKPEGMSNQDGVQLWMIEDQAVLADFMIQIQGREYKGIATMFLNQHAGADLQSEQSVLPAANAARPGLYSLRAHLLQSAGYLLLPLYIGEWDRLNGLHAAQDALLASKSGVL